MRIAAHNSSADDQAAAERVCTGSSDQVTIQNAIQSTSVASVELMAGEYNFTDKLWLGRDGFTLKGQGRRTLIRRIPPHGGFLIQCLELNGTLSGLEIANLAFDDAGATVDTGVATNGTATVQVFKANDVWLHGLVVENIYRTGIIALASSNVLVEGCITRDARATKSGTGYGGDGGIGIKFHSDTYKDPAAIPSKNNRVRNCEVSGCWRVGIWSCGVNGLTVEDNYAHDNMPQIAVDHGIEPGGQIGVGSGCTMVSVVDNHTHGGVKTIGVEFDVTNFGTPNGVPVQNAIIARNRIHDQGLCGILLTVDPNSAITRCNTVIADNVIANTSGQFLPGFGAIMMNPNITHFIIQGNMVTEQKNRAAIIGTGTNHYVVANNHFESIGSTTLNATGAFLDRGGASKKIGANLLVVNGTSY